MTERTHRSRPAFTLIELLVVILILILVLTLAVPAFTSMLYTSEQSLAENSLKIGLTAARDAALRSASGEDSAAVFFYEPGGRVSIVPCLKVGQVMDFSNQLGAAIKRDVFAPVPSIEPAQLPKGWTVRGYAAPNTIDEDWYEQTYVGNSRLIGNWIFPETGFFDVDDGVSGEQRQTFMLRFEGGTGTLTFAHPAPALVLSPSPSAAFRSVAPWNINDPAFRADLEPDPARFVRRILADGTFLTNQQKRDLLGDRASDTVLARSVGQLTLLHERTLASSIGVRVDQGTGCLYGAPSASGPQLLPGVSTTKINAWIERRLLDLNGDVVESDARLFAVQRYLGWLQEMAQ